MRQTESREQTEGLSPEEVEHSRREHGDNRLPQRKGKSLARRFLSNLNDPVIHILLVALGVHLILTLRGGDWIETVGIGVAVLLASLISTLSEHRSEAAFSRLAQSNEGVLCRVRRAGRTVELAPEELVVGDLLLLSAGEGVPADGSLVWGSATVDQSAITGESREVEKQSGPAPVSPVQDPSEPTLLLRGSTLTRGECRMRVTRVGENSFFGAISKEIQEERRESPLKLRLSVLAHQISRLGYVAAGMVALAYLFNVFVLDSGMIREVIRYRLTNPTYLLSHLFHALTLALTVVVVAVPEGLPMMIAVVLSSNTRRMVRDRVLVRKPSGIEAAGSMNMLFTDKTGTLTEGEMRLQGIALATGEVRTPRELLEEGAALGRWTALAFRWGCSASEGVSEDGKKQAMGGSPTERALLSSVLCFPCPEGYRLRSRLEFDSARKYSAVSLGGREEITLVMGAPERLLPSVRSAVRSDGGEIAFRAEEIRARIREHAARGERVMLLAASAEGVAAAQMREGIVGGLLLLGILLLRDPLRREAKKSVARLQRAGVQVVMITGDGRETAEAIARECGILSSTRTQLLTGEELAHLPDRRVIELLPQLAVIARALPTDKSRLVRLAEEAGLVTGMTGDGINDAPALRKADVGFAMGSGTQVAKDAGDIIILDDNLASVARAVLYGRTVFKSIRKFITLQLLMNFCAMSVTMIGPFLGIDAPVTVVQMLWINLIMDTLGGLAFAGEPPLEAYMEEPPKKREEPILNRYMIHTILWEGGFAVCLYLLFLKHPFFTSCFRASEGQLVHLTAFFALFIFSSVLHCFNARTDRLRLLADIRKNPVFLGIMLGVLVIQVGFIYLGGSVLRTVPLNGRELLITLSVSLAVLPAELCRKLLLRLLGRKGGY